jgi:hypothetical protein
MSIAEAFKEMITLYFQTIAMIPLWITLPMLALLIWFTFFKYKGPQRTIKIWMAGFASAWFSGQKDRIANVAEIEEWCGDEIERGLKDDFAPVPMPKIKYKRERSKKVDCSFVATYRESSPGWKMAFKILIVLAILVTLAKIIVLSLKAFGVF